MSQAIHSRKTPEGDFYFRVYNTVKRCYETYELTECEMKNHLLEKIIKEARVVIDSWFQMAKKNGTSEIIEIYRDNMKWDDEEE